jgi:hypothetical protein
MVTAGAAGMFLSLACHVLTARSLCPNIPTLASYIRIAWLTHRFVFTDANVVSHDLTLYRGLLVREHRPSYSGRPHNPNPDKQNYYLVHRESPFVQIVV